MAEQVDYIFKLVLIGDMVVGKTQMLSRFAQNEFSLKSEATIDVDCQTRTLVVCDKIVKAQIWDTGGQERYRAIKSAFYRALTSTYYRGALGALLVYDITKRESFDHIPCMLEELRAEADKNVVIMLIGNKSDLVEERAVSTEDAEEFAQMEGLFFVETSALDSTNVDSAFTTVLTEIFNLQIRKNIVANGNGDVLKLPGKVIVVPGSGQDSLASSSRCSSSCLYDLLVFLFTSFNH